MICVPCSYVVAQLEIKFSLVILFISDWNLFFKIPIDLEIIFIDFFFKSQDLFYQWLENFLALKIVLIELLEKSQVISDNDFISTLKLWRNEQNF